MNYVIIYFRAYLLVAKKFNHKKLYNSNVTHITLIERNNQRAKQMCHNEWSATSFLPRILSSHRLDNMLCDNATELYDIHYAFACIFKVSVLSHFFLYPAEVSYYISVFGAIHIWSTITEPLRHDEM